MSSEIDQVLECSGKDSGKEECWPPWVNIGVPVVISIAFVLVLLIMFVVWPKKSPSSDEEEGQVFVPPKWLPNEKSQFGDSSNGASISNTHQRDENFV